MKALPKTTLSPVAPGLESRRGKVGGRIESKKGDSSQNRRHKSFSTCEVSDCVD